MTKNVCAHGLIALVSAICLCSIAAAQTSWWRTYGWLDDDMGHSVQQTADGGYVIAGGACPLAGPYTDVYLIKTSAQGDTLWTRTCGGPYGDVGNSVQQTTDGGYVVAGESVGESSRDVYLIKTSASGDILWTRTHGGFGNESGNSVQQTADGGYIIAGYTGSFGAGFYDVYLIKANAQGDTLWTRTYGGTRDEEGNSVRQTNDGGYVIAGYTCSFGEVEGDVYLIKTNAQGDTLWTRTYGGTHEDVGLSVRQTTDGGYVIAGYTHSFGAGTPANHNIYLVKTNSQGDTLWTRTYGGSGGDDGNSIQQTPDGGYVIAGRIGGATDDNVCLMKTNASGDTLWTRTYGGSGSDRGLSVQRTTDDGYIIAGYTASYGAGWNDVYLIKTDSLGNVGVAEPLTGHALRPTRFLVQPNPFTSFARVPGHETEFFTLSDVTGRQVAICKGDRVGEGLRPGVYFLSPVGPRAGNAAATTIVKTAF